MGIKISVPLFLRNTFRGVETAGHEAIQAEKAEPDLVQRARSDVEGALVRYRVDRDASALWNETGRTSLAERLDLLNRMWRAGALDATDYLVQLNRALTTEAARVEARGELWQSWVALLESSGRIAQQLGLAS